jgi:hypothetical protein
MMSNQKTVPPTQRHGRLRVVVGHQESARLIPDTPKRQRPLRAESTRYVEQS